MPYLKLVVSFVRKENGYHSGIDNINSRVKHSYDETSNKGSSKLATAAAGKDVSWGEGLLERCKCLIKRENDETESANENADNLRTTGEKGCSIDDSNEDEDG